MRFKVLAAVAAAAVAGATLAAVWPAPGAPHPAGIAPEPAPPTPLASIETAAALTPQERDRIGGLLDAHLSDQPGRLALAVQEMRTGATFEYAAGTGFSTASAVKLDLVVHMLLRAEAEDRFLTEHEAALAERMLRYSDNDAADAAYQHNGFTPGFIAASARLGLPDTRPDRGGVWGASRTTAADRIRLLRAVFTPVSPLSERGREYVRSLMGSVAPEQAWGISAAADRADSAQLKNGWAPAETDGGRWIVNSTGRIERGGRAYLVAILSDRHADYGTGVACVEGAARLVVEELAKALD